MPCPECARSDRMPSTETALPVFALEFSIVTNGSTTPSSFAGHGMPCPYCEIAIGLCGAAVAVILVDSID